MKIQKRTNDAETLVFSKHWNSRSLLCKNRLSVPPGCPCWCGSRAARCTPCTWAAPCPCPCWRTGTGGWCCWRWWGRSHSRTARSARTPSSSGQTCAWWRWPMVRKHTHTHTPRSASSQIEITGDLLVSPFHSYFPSFYVFFYVKALWDNACMKGALPIQFIINVC